MRKTKGLFISFEGGEGSGKTSLIQSLEGFFLEENLPFVITREPGGCLLSERIRDWLLDASDQVPLSMSAELLLFLASRAQHLHEVIQPALDGGKIVLCDRFNDSSVVYQGIARGLGKDYVQSFCDLLCGELVPSLTFLLDVPPKIGLKRAGAFHDNQGDRIERETLDFHERVREGFLTLAKESKERIFVVDAQKSPQEVYSLVLDKLLDRQFGIKSSTAYLKKHP